MQFWWFPAIFFLLALASPPVQAAAQDSFRPEPRVILAFYDGRDHQSYWLQRPHRLAETPLNHLGLILRHRDIRAPLPDLREMADVRGVLLWMSSAATPDPARFIHWCVQTMKAGIRLVLMGSPPFGQNDKGVITEPGTLRPFWRTLGLEPRFDWIRFTHKTRLLDSDSRIMDFERGFSGLLPPFETLKRRDPRMTVHLTGRQFNDPKSDAVLVTTSPHGGYVADGYELYIAPGEDFIQWRIDPFAFFALAFDAWNLPKPDATVLSGRRIFYSHIDGDGWRNISQVEGYRQKKKLSAEVVLEEILKPYPDFPSTVAPIVADIDGRLDPNPDIQKIAREIFLLPHVEAGNHTYTHPLFWQFFEAYQADKEAPYLWLYPQPLEGDYLKRLASLFDLDARKEKVQMDTGVWKRELNNAIKSKEKKPNIVMDYRTPRVYRSGDFRLEQEFGAANAVIERLTPPGKRVQVVQWSGDTLPFEAAIAAARAEGMTNINGGDSRFDKQYPSIAWVAPLGRQVGDQWQTYASNSNENTYTELWTANFFGFKQLIRTIRNTGHPLLLKPFNLYYHMYSGERVSSLNALRHNLEYARALPLTPVATSHFARIVEGTVSARLERGDPEGWRILERGAMQTIRFDRALFQAVDLIRSQGVIGQKHYQGSLYVSLEADHPAPVIILKDHPQSGQRPQATIPYLVESRWLVRGVAHPSAAGVVFRVQGFGPGQMVWQSPWRGGFIALLRDDDGRLLEKHQGMIEADGLIRFTFSASALDGAAAELRFQPDVAEVAAPS